MYVADMHCDSLSRVSSEQGLLTDYNFSKKYKQLQFAAAFVAARGETPEARRKRLMRFLDIYIAESKRLGLVTVGNCHDLNFAIEFERSSSLFSLEGGGGLFADSDELSTLYRAGLRVLGLCWDSNELAASAWEKCDTGLTDEGRKLVQRASEMGIILDISHLSDRSAEELLELSPYPVLATHSNFRDICDSPRNLTRSLASKVARRGGVIGLNIYPPFLTLADKATGDDILRHVDYALENFGEDCLGFGFDIDGTDGEYPIGFSEEGGSIHDRVIELLLSKYKESVVEKIAGGNVISFCKNNL